MLIRDASAASSEFMYQPLNFFSTRTSEIELLIYRVKDFDSEGLVAEALEDTTDEDKVTYQLSHPLQ